MLKSRIIALFALLGVTAFAAAPPADGPERPWLRAKLLDIGSPVFADRFPEGDALAQPLQTPRGNRVTFRLALESPEAAEVAFAPRNCLRVGDKEKAPVKITVRPMGCVKVEGNTQWPVKNYPGGEVMESWKPYLIRQAPFDLFEVVEPTVVTGAKLEAGKLAVFLVTLDVSEQAQKGLYQSDFVVESKGRADLRLPVLLDVSSVALPKRFSLDSTHWLWPEPVNLTSGPVPAYWSEEHWKLLEAAGRALRENGDNMIYTPIIFAEVPLIQTVKSPDGQYRFDFTGFRRWVKTFQALGFDYFSGTHMSSWMLPLYVKDEATGARRKIDLKDPEFAAVLEAFLPQLNTELKTLGIQDRYLQYQQDEPRADDFESYKRFADIRKRCMPGVKSIDAILDQKNLYGELVDIQVLNLGGAWKLRDRIKAAPERYWLYCCTSPYPPLPNRHLDRMPLENRLWPLLAVDFNATGFLNWAANIYRGVNEYEGSLGPMPNGSRNPGHPPGDNWFFYRGPEGLRGGARMLNYRDGLVDATLFSMLKAKNPAAAENLLKRVIYPEMDTVYRLNYGWKDAAKRVGRTYSVDPAQYNILRGELLDALEKAEAKP